MSGSRPEITTATAENRSAPHGARRATRPLLTILLLVAVLAAFWPALGGALLNWDDNAYVSDNPLLRTTDGLRRIWLTLEAPQYYPLTFTAYWIQYRLWQAWAPGYHAVNVAFHLLNVVLVLMLFRRLGLSRSAAWIGAAAFGLHPIQVASVAWTAELKNVLSTAFYLPAMLAYLRWREGGRGWWYAVCLVLFAAALLSKTATLMLPGSLFFCDVLLLRRRAVGSIGALVPFGVLSLAAAGVTVLAEGGESAATVPAIEHRPLVAAASILFYLWKVVWPVELLGVYPRWSVGLSWWPGWVCLSALLVGLATAIALRKRIAARVWWGGSHFLVNLLPVLGLVPFGYMEKSFVADHFIYVPAIGIFLIAGLAADAPARIGPRGLVVRNLVVLLVLAAYGARTWRQTTIWKSSERLWTHTLDGNPDCHVALNNLGLVHMERDEVDEAIRLFRRAIDVDPRYADALVNLGSALARQNRMDRAEALLRQAVAHSPTDVRARTNLANLLAGRQRFEEAMEHYRSAIEAEPRYVDAYYNAALAEERRGNPSAATELFEQALAIDPSHLESWIGLGRVARGRRDIPRAENAYRKAVALRPDDPRAYEHLATVLHWQDRWSDAIQTLRQALASAGPYPSLQAALASLLAACPDDSLRDGQEAVRLARAANEATRHGDAACLDALAQALAEQADFVGARNMTERALQIARKKQYRQLEAGLTDRLADYEAKRPYRYRSE